jgi:hypothetical protein
MRIYPGFWRGRYELDNISYERFKEWIDECKLGK